MAQESAQDVASLIQSATTMPRGQAALGWAEFLPRYLLIEDLLKDRRVLEIGTRDARSLAKLQEAGATRVVGTTVNPGAFERTRFRSPSVELLAMDSGRIDFGDLAFDVILVVDLGVQLSHNPRFLEEIKRVLSPDGFCMLAFPGPGRDLTHLFDAEPELSVMATNHLEAAVRQAFPQARLLQQAPFVGVAIHPQGRPPAEIDVALEPALAGGVGRPSQVLALCGRGAPNLTDRTLVELPFTDFEAMTDAAQARVSSDIRRLLGALEEARATTEAREISLRDVRQRLPKLRAALQKKLQSAPLHSGSQIVSPTVLERPELSEAGPGDTVFVPEPVPTVLEETPAYLDLQTQIQGLQASDATHVQALASAKVLQDEMQIALAESEAQLQAIRHEPTPADNHDDARRRIAQLEHTLGNYEQQIHGLQGELEAEKEVRYTLGSDHRDVEMRMNHVRAQLEQQVLLRSQAEARLLQRETFLAEALSKVDQERDSLRVRVHELEVGETQYKEQMRLTLAASEHAQQVGAQSRAQTDALHGELDVARAEAQRFARDNEDLRHTLRAQEAVLAQASAKDADRRAVEMAAAHLSREVESLRRRVQDLRNERDTLAATSQMLLDERDTARALARRAVGAERSAATLSQTLGEAEQIIEGHEVEARAAQDRIENLHRAVAELREHNKGLKGELQVANRDSQSLQQQRSESVLRVQRLDQHLAGVQAELRGAKEAQAKLRQERDDLEEMLRELASTARAAIRDVARGEQVQLDLRGQLSALIDERADIEAARGRAEAEHVTAVSAVASERMARAQAIAMLAEVQSDRVYLKDKLQKTGQRIEALSGQLADALNAAPEVIEVADLGVTDELERLRKAKSDADIGLGRTLEEAAKLSDRVSQMQRELDDAASRLQKGEVERLAVERQRRAAAETAKSAEAARLQGLAEIQVLRERAKRLEFERADLVRDCDARAMRAQQQERRFGELQGEYSSLEANAQAVEQVQLQKMQELQDEIQGLRATASGAEQASLAELEFRLESSRTHTEGLASEVARLTHERGAFVAQIHELEDRIEVRPEVSYSFSRIEVEAHIDPSWMTDTFRTQIEDLKGEQAVLRSSLMEREEDLAAARAYNEQLRIRADHLVTQAQPLDPEILGVWVERIQSKELVAEAARAESEVLKDRHECAQSALQDARAQILHLGVRCEELEAVVDGLRGARSLEQGRVVEMSSQWRQAQEAEALQAMLRQGLSSEQDGLRQDNVELRAQLQAAQTRTQQAQWYLGEREAELAVVRVDLSAARQALEVAKLETWDLREAVQARNAEVQLQREHGERALAEAGEKLGALETAAVDAEYRAQGTDDELQAVQQELDALAEQSEQSRADLEGRVRDAEAAKALAVQGQNSAESALKSAQDSLQKMQQEAERSEAAFADRGAELARQRNDYEAAMDEAQGQSEAAARDQAELSAQVEQLHAEQAKVEADLKRAEAGLEEAEVARGKAQDEATSLAEQVERLVAEAETQRSQAEAIHQALQVQVDEAIEAQSLSDARVLELEREAQALELARSEAETNADQLARTAAQLQSQLDAAESEASADAAEAADLLTLLEGEATQAATVITGLKDQVRDLESLQAEAQSRAQAAEQAVHLELDQVRADLLAQLSAAETAQAESKVALAAAKDALSRSEEAIAVREREFEAAHAQLHSEAATAMAAKQRELAEAQAQADANKVAAQSEIADKLAQAKAALAETEVARAAGAEGARAQQAAAELKSTLQVSETEQSRLKEELSEAEASHAALQAEHQARLDECTGLKLDLSVAVAAQAKAEATLADVQMASIEAEVAHQAMQVRCGKLEAAGRQLLGERARLVGELSNVQAKAQAAPTSPDNEALSRVLARAGDAEMRAERAEATSERARNDADAATLTTAQAGERLKAAEARADRAEQSLRKEVQQAKDAEARAVHAEAAVQECRDRAQDLEARRRGLEARVLEADKKSQHSGRRLEELSAQLRQTEARQRSAGDAMPASEADLQAEVRGLQTTVDERDLDIQRLEGLSEQARQALDEARADTGRRLNELRAARERLEQVQTELVEAQAQAQALDARLQASGDSGELRAQLALHSAEIARLNANGATLQGERSRLHTLIEDSEQRQVQGERRVAELEAALSERTHRIEMLTREIQEKNERLRRLSGLE